MTKEQAQAAIDADLRETFPGGSWLDMAELIREAYEEAVEEGEDEVFFKVPSYWEHTIPLPVVRVALGL